MSAAVIIIEVELHIQVFTMISFIIKKVRSDGNGINSVFLTILLYLSVMLLLSITVVLVLKKGSRKRRSNFTGAKTRQRNVANGRFYRQK